MDTPVAPLVIGMIDEIDDEDSLAFSKGFYGALAAGLNAEAAYDEGVIRIHATDGNQHVVAKLVGSSS